MGSESISHVFAAPSSLAYLPVNKPLPGPISRTVLLLRLENPVAPKCLSKIERAYWSLSMPPARNKWSLCQALPLTGNRDRTTLAGIFTYHGIMLRFPLIDAPTPKSCACRAEETGERSEEHTSELQSHVNL